MGSSKETFELNLEGQTWQVERETLGECVKVSKISFLSKKKREGKSYDHV